MVDLVLEIQLNEIVYFENKKTRKALILSRCPEDDSIYHLYATLFDVDKKTGYKHRIPIFLEHMDLKRMNTFLDFVLKTDPKILFFNDFAELEETLAP